MIEYFHSLSLSINILIFYLLIINVVTFLYFGFDKMKSRLGHRRIPEKTLFLLAILGGSVGALFAMNTFRHKTKKVSFQTILGLVIAAQTLLIYLLISY
ncbi:MAG: DUF1294 domain-containing protein [Candidatus Magasanikbacteria bacterium]